MINTGNLYRAQVLACRIGLVQGCRDRLAILGRYQRIGRAEHTGEPCLNLRQQGQRGFTTSWPHSAYARSIEIKGLLNPGQRGRQKRCMPPEAEAHNMDSSVRVSGPQPIDSRSNIAEDLMCGGGILVTPPLGQIGRFVGQLQSGAVRANKGTARVG